MLEVYGRVFRRQEQQRPWWWTALLSLGILVGLAWVLFFCLGAGRVALWCLQAQDPGHQLPAARLAGLLAGAIALSALVKTWRRRLFLEGPIRDLAVSPGSPWQVLKVALRLRWWHVASVPVVLLSVLLTPWFMEPFAQLSTDFQWVAVDDPRWQLLADLLHHGGWVLAFLSSAVTVLMLHGVFTVTAIAIGLILSAAGLGGVAPRSLFLDRLFRYGMVLATIVGFAALFSTIAYWMSIGQEPPHPGWWRVGQWCHLVLVGEHPLFEWLRWFPGIALGDVLHGLTLTEHSVAFPWFGILIWGVAATVVAGVFFRAGYSFQARSGFGREEAAVAPADAGRIERRSFDPDAVNGPFESLFIAWLGRMGRAVLRMVSANMQSGALDYLLVRTMFGTASGVLLGHIAMLMIPAGLDAILTVYGQSPLSAEAVGNVRSTVAVFFLILLALFCLITWGGHKTWQTGARVYARNEQTEAAAGSWGALFRRKKTATRGDRRYPLIEIYAVGFADAVLLPTLYAGFWLLVSGAAIGLTGLL